MTRKEDNDVIIEYQAMGNLVRVSAVDPKTMTEVVIQGPSSAGRDLLARRAMEKLRYVLTKKGADS